MEFKDFLLKLESQAITDKPIKQLGGTPPNDNDGFDDDGNNDDDEQWQWDNLKRFDLPLMQWANTSPFAIKIKNAIFTKIFKQKPEIEVKEYHPNYDDDNEYESELAPSGTVILSVQWKLPEEEIEEALFNTLRSNQSDLWKPLQVPPNELWTTLDKGDVFHYVFYHINSAILGSNVQYSNQYYDKNRPDGSKFDPEYFSLQKAWEKDKATFEKYTKFVVYEKQTELEKHAKDFFTFDVKLEKYKESFRALVWHETYDASALIWYNYEKI